MGRSLIVAILGWARLPAEVARFLGHRNINVTYAIYGHLLRDANERAIAALDAEFERWSKAGKKE
jgi:integrase